MAEKTKNLCAQIPESLHDTVRSHQLESGKTMNAYMTELLTHFYENQKGMTSMENTRTLAVQIDAELRKLPISGSAFSAIPCPPTYPLRYAAFVSAFR